MRATAESRRKFEIIYREAGYESMTEFAKAAGLNYANLSRVFNGKQGEGNILVRIASFLHIPYNELRKRCGFCGVDGEEAFEELNAEFLGHHNTTIVGNSNSVNNSVADKMKEEPASAEARIKELEEEIKRKDEKIKQLEADKAFLQELLKKR